MIETSVMKELKQWLFCDILKEYLIQTDDIDKSNDEEIKKQVLAF